MALPYLPKSQFIPRCFVPIQLRILFPFGKDYLSEHTQFRQHNYFVSNFRNIKTSSPVLPTIVFYKFHPKLFHLHAIETIQRPFALFTNLF